MRPVKHSVKYEGRKTSVSLEPEFWSEVLRLSGALGVTIGEYVEDIDAHRSPPTNLSCALRLHVLRQIQAERDAAIGAAQRIAGERAAAA